MGLHLRIVSPPDRTEGVLDLLCGIPSVVNVIELPGAARRPEGDVILCDVAREDASVIISDLKDLGIHRDGSIAIESIDTEISVAATEAERAAPGAPSDAVVWEEIEARTSDEATLSAVYMAFMVLAALIAAVGIFLDSAILIVGAMVVGPEFGPIAGFCVAVVQRRSKLARRSLVALVIGFPAAIVITYVTVLVFKAVGVAPGTFSEADHGLSSSIANPDFFAWFVAVCAGIAGILSLTSAKSGALIGVVISVTTIPAAANVGVAAAYEDWESFQGSLAQLGINIFSILLAGTALLALQRANYDRRRDKYTEQKRARRRRRSRLRGRTPA